MFAELQTGTSLSPCSPTMNAWTERASTPKWSDRAARKRAVSRIVPDPMTRSGGRPDRRHDSYDRMSTGFVATRMMPFGLASATCGTIWPKIAVFLRTRSRRVSPGFCPTPAAITVTAAPAQSAYEPAHTRVGFANGTACCRSIASPSARRSFASISTISAASPDSSRA